MSDEIKKNIKMSNPVVFFDITIADRPVGRIVMTLRADVNIIILNKGKFIRKQPN